MGKTAESDIARWLIKRGQSVLPVYEKIIDEGKGPQLFTGGEGLIAPDMLAICKGKVLWIEAKHKTGFAFYRKGNKFVTGIDLRHYLDYLRVAAITELPIYLLFLHDGGVVKDSPPGPSGLYGNYLSVLSQREDHRSGKWGKSGMVYWARDIDGGPLRLLATLEEMNIK